MKIKRLVLTLTLMLALIPGLVRPAAALSETDIIKQLLACYCHYQEAAETDIARLLEQLAEVNPASADAWRKILEVWRWSVEELEVNWDVLPDGLPQDNSLCIIVMGFRLNDGGVMDPELLSRLEVALASAEKYPNAYILCTGGGTAPHNPYVTEAGQMAKWLEEQGIAPERIIVESRSISTEENAMYAYRILAEDYPQVTSIALVSSDYHLRRCHLLFNAGILLPEPDLPYTIVGDACFEAGYEGTQEGYFEETANLGRMLDIWTVNLPKPALSLLTGIRVSGVAEYNFGEALQLTVAADYDCGYSRDVTSRIEISGFDSELPGEQVVTVTYTENGVTITQDLSVTVATPPTTEAPTTQPETTAAPSLPPETIPEPVQPPARGGNTRLWGPVLGAAALGIGLLCLISRPRRGKYEKRRKS